jgi:hypothetical protein
MLNRVGPNARRVLVRGGLHDASGIVTPTPSGVIHVMLKALHEPTPPAVLEHMREPAAITADLCIPA